MKIWSVKTIIERKIYGRLNKMNDPGYFDEYSGIPCGIRKLDDIVTGLYKSDLIVLAARPGMGKTTFALNIARNAAVDSGKRVYFFSMELSKEKLVERLISGESGIDTANLHKGVLTAEQREVLKEAGDRLSAANLFIDDTPSLSVFEIREKLCRSKKPDMVVIDHLGLMRSNGRFANGVAETTEITHWLKITAREMNIPVIVCTQLSRSSKKEGTARRPVLADLPFCVERDADVVLLLHKDPYSDENEPTPDNVFNCIVAKNLHGGTGTVDLNWDMHHLKFS